MSFHALANMVRQRMSNETNNSKRLNTWKEIAHFFRKTERTVIRWERERSLPVHRLPGASRSQVFAYEDELRLWLTKSNFEELSNQKLETGESENKSFSKISKKSIMAVFAILILLIGLVFFINFRKPKNEISIEAHNHYLKAIENWNTRSPSSLNQAVLDFQRAIELEPNYAMAYVGLADCYNLLPEYTKMPASQAFPLAIKAAKNAIEIDDKLAGAHLAYAFALFNGNWDFSNAKKEFERAFELDKNSAQIHHWYATSLLTLGEYDNAINHINRALEINPASISIRADRALILLRAGRKLEARDLLLSLIKENKDFRSPHTYLSEYYFFAGDYSNYLLEAETSARLGDNLAAQTLIKKAKAEYEKNGEKGLIQTILNARLQQFETGNGTATQVGLAYLILGEEKAAWKYIERAIERRDDDAIYIQSDPALEKYRDRPEYKRLVQKLLASKI